MELGRWLHVRDQNFLCSLRVRKEHSPFENDPFTQSKQTCGCLCRGQGPAKARTHLVDDVDAVVQLLPLQEGVQVLQQVYQVLLSVPVGNEDGHPLQGLTSLGMTPASGHSGVLCLYFLQSEVWFKNELALASCNQHEAYS